MSLKKPIIGITTYGRNEENHFTLPAEYVESVRRAGGIPILLPPGETEITRGLLLVDGVILAGGGDISPELYQGKSHDSIYMLDAERDAFELETTTQVLNTGKPTLGICRGAQMINVALGGTLHAHLPDVYGEVVLHRKPPRIPISHPVSVQQNSLLAKCLNATEVTVSSWHHQAIDQLGAGIEVSALAPDEVIEGFEIPTHPWLVAVQWHPELTAVADVVQQNLFNAFIEKCTSP